MEYLGTIITTLINSDLLQDGFANFPKMCDSQVSLTIQATQCVDQSSM